MLSPCGAISRQPRQRTFMLILTPCSAVELGITKVSRVYGAQSNEVILFDSCCLVQVQLTLAQSIEEATAIPSQVHGRI